MNPTERADVLVTARLLRAAGRVDWLGTGLTIVAGAALLFEAGNVAAAASALALGLVAKVYFVRVSLDARLLEDVASGKLETEGLDAALAALGRKPKTDGVRSWPDRCRGARRLVVIASVLTIAEGAALALAWLPV